MHLALLEALKSAWLGQIPVGAVVVVNNQIVFIAHNQNKFQHAEMLVCEYVFKHNIQNYDLYLTLEPCIMCWFALHQTSIKRLFFGTNNNDIGGISLQIKWKKQKTFEFFGEINKEINRLLLISFFDSCR